MITICVNLLHGGSYIVQASFSLSIQVSLVYRNGWRDVSAIISASERLRSEMHTEREPLNHLALNPRFLRWIPVPHLNFRRTIIVWLNTCY